jgi:single-stranded DNA-binding protein
MIDALISGRLHGIAEQRQGQNGSLYVTCKLKAMTDNGDSIMCNVIAFKDELRSLLTSLNDGDTVSLSGSISPIVWTDKQGKVRPALDLVAQRGIGLSGEN